MNAVRALPERAEYGQGRAQQKIFFWSPLSFPRMTAKKIHSPLRRNTFLKGGGDRRKWDGQREDGSPICGVLTLEERLTPLLHPLWFLHVTKRKNLSPSFLSKNLSRFFQDREHEARKEEEWKGKVKRVLLLLFHLILRRKEEDALRRERERGRWKEKKKRKTENERNLLLQFLSARLEFCSRLLRRLLGTLFSSYCLLGKERRERRSQ